MRVENTLMDVCERNDNLPAQNLRLSLNRTTTTSRYAKTGLEGNLSNLRYFSHALSAFEINNIVKGGPSLMAANNTGSMTNKTHTTYRTVGITQMM
jgi:hypothetical protein